MASQSSLLRSEYPAERAVDGNTGTILYPLKECTHTDLEYEPWWKVDLGDTYVISHVTVINRGDCCARVVGEAEMLAAYWSPLGWLGWESEVPRGGGVTAISPPAVSPSWWDEGASRGDKITTGEGKITGDLDPGRAKSLEISGDKSRERLRNFMVRVGPYEDFRENTPCGDIYSETPSEGETIDVRCEEPISGRWVSVQLIGREDYLSLCEVQVFSGTESAVEQPANNTGKRWRDDLRCGPEFPAPDAAPGECDPDSCFPCCSQWGHCGNTPDHCDCADCVNYGQIYGVEQTPAWRDLSVSWRLDLRCGDGFSAPGAAVAECDPHSCNPCCSGSGWCGNTEGHCGCPDCVDYRSHGDGEMMAAAVRSSPLPGQTQENVTPFRCSHAALRLVNVAGQLRTADVKDASISETVRQQVLKKYYVGDENQC
ncbi:hypothetical protein Bbelb_443250 [Branchiostoma belcheri]|nr:hypothetical protein Bbelb_443250 [Branchiostoma belcheri]